VTGAAPPEAVGGTPSPLEDDTRNPNMNEFRIDHRRCA
jgi:hypothetical protein